MKKNIAVIGCGHWGKNLVRNFAQVGALYAVCDGNLQVAEKFASEFDAKALDFDAVINDEAVQGVVIATPAETHAGLALHALANSKHVYVEKPLSLDISDAESMIAKAKEMDKILMVGHLLHYHPAYITLKTMVDSGALGALRYVYSNRLSYGKLRSEENVFWSFAPHDVSMILGLTGAEPSSIYAHYHDSVQSGIADFATAHMTFPNQVQAHIQTSWLHPFKEQRLVVTGTQGMLIFDDTKAWDQKLALYRHDIDFSGPVPMAVKAEADYIALEEGEPLRNECEHFVDCVAGRHAPRTDGDEGLRVLKVLKACDIAAQDTSNADQAAA